MIGRTNAGSGGTDKTELVGKNAILNMYFDAQIGNGGTPAISYTVQHDNTPIKIDGWYITTQKDNALDADCWIQASKNGSVFASKSDTHGHVHVNISAQTIANKGNVIRIETGGNTEALNKVCCLMIISGFDIE